MLHRLVLAILQREPPRLNSAFSVKIRSSGSDCRRCWAPLVYGASASFYEPFERGIGANDGASKSVSRMEGTWVFLMIPVFSDRQEFAERKLRELRGGALNSFAVQAAWPTLLIRFARRSVTIF